MLGYPSIEDAELNQSLRDLGISVLVGLVLVSY